ncbi:MAG: 6,7-dimethyl-8-ribityllumazine synthase [Candidatus Thermoplasmatota archaeon]|nr:6,7-dimethyl-8-ribityllumazine synthase [Candidatus Thermoplasmatota archaeon]
MPNLGIVVSEFHADVTERMLVRAEEHATFQGLTVTHVVKVPGVFDMPLALKRLIRRDDVDGVVALGAVVQGETGHDAVIMAQTARQIADLAVEYEKPIGLGITGPGQTKEQALDRVEKAREAVEAVAKLLQTLEGV